MYRLNLRLNTIDGALVRADFVPGINLAVVHGLVPYEYQHSFKSNLKTEEFIVTLVHAVRGILDLEDEQIIDKFSNTKYKDLYKNAYLDGERKEFIIARTIGLIDGETGIAPPPGDVTNEFYLEGIKNLLRILNPELLVFNKTFAENLGNKTIKRESCFLQN